jgi:Na+/proline symporter
MPSSTSISVAHLVQRVSANDAVASAFTYPTSLGTWIVLNMLSAFAIIMLPRQFYVTIVENRSEAELKTATWLFPLYLVLINLFVLPVAYAGMVLVGPSTDADLYVLSLPLMHGQDLLAMFVFVGGLSAATAMVIVASVALSIMISNNLVLPLFVKGIVPSSRRGTKDWTTVILNIRRAAIFMVLLAAFLYYRGTTGNARLAAIGLISFAAIAQFAPAFFGGLLWRGANSRGAALGMTAGLRLPPRARHSSRTGRSASKRFDRRRCSEPPQTRSTTACCGASRSTRCSTSSGRCHGLPFRWSASRPPCSCRARQVRCRA